MATSAEADRNAVLEKLTHTKAEHAEIISVIAADPGMSPATRSTLLAHLMEEEDELVAELKGGEGDASDAAWTVGTLRGGASGPASSTAASNWSVGDLRLGR